MNHSPGDYRVLLQLAASDDSLSRERAQTVQELDWEELPINATGVFTVDLEADMYGTSCTLCGSWRRNCCTADKGHNEWGLWPASPVWPGLGGSAVKSFWKSHKQERPLWCHQQEETTTLLSLSQVRQMEDQCGGKPRLEWCNRWQLDWSKVTFRFLSSLNTPQFTSALLLR